ncbi:unnamed protein product [Allacma fusca]|uniref:Uncharacterized protein n=1 Tax=Allacma fusca TaxID=39272 RepID=A0A8J2L7D9_9HEXA|nr:unnamed protein product [Allacma fusca]
MDGVCKGRTCAPLLLRTPLRIATIAPTNYTYHIRGGNLRHVKAEQVCPNRCTQVRGSTALVLPFSSSPAEETSTKSSFFFSKN